jgi:hypothetical protein
LLIGNTIAQQPIAQCYECFAAVHPYPRVQ